MDTLLVELVSSMFKCVGVFFFNKAHTLVELFSSKFKRVGVFFFDKAHTLVELFLQRSNVLLFSLLKIDVCFLPCLNGLVSLAKLFNIMFKWVCVLFVKTLSSKFPW